MAGDASLSITPVMKWNFERSCYRWLVTRHPAQFERMDFTAQILQSASRARKAFYECGWAEAKVLIRPSDGKFERTPFFDTIIRRGLRNSTRFDASTLTEEEVEALGMHRDESLGFKLQIRHFRRRNKEIVPRPTVEVPRSTPPSPVPQGHPPNHVMVPANTHPQPRTSARSPPCPAHASIDWRPGASSGSASERHRIWMPDRANWHGGPNGVDVSGSPETTIVPWNGMRHWRTPEGSENRSDERDVDHHTNALAPVQPCDWRSEPPRRSRGAWEGPPRKVWSFNEMASPHWDAGKAEDDRVRAGVGVNGGGGGGGGGGGDCSEFEGAKIKQVSDVVSRSNRGEHSDEESTAEDSRACVSGSSSSSKSINSGNDEKSCSTSSAGACGGVGRSAIPPPVMEPRGNLMHHLDGRGAPRNVATQHRGSMDGRIGGCGSSEPVEPGAGGLLAQGYMRLAAMRDGLRKHGVPMTGIPSCRAKNDLVSPGPHASGEMPPRPAPLSRAPDRSLSAAFSGQSLPPITDRVTDHARPPRRSRSPEVEADPPCKRRRELENSRGEGDADRGIEKACVAGGASLNPSSSQAQGETRESPSEERGRIQVARSLTPPASAADVSDRQARDFAESERELMSASHAFDEAKMRLDEAKMRLDEATRAHRAKREQMMAATGGLKDTKPPARNAQNDRDVHAHPSSATADVRGKVSKPCTDGDDAEPSGNKTIGRECRVTAMASRSAHEDQAEDRDHDECVSGASDAPAVTSAAADDMTDVKAEAEILCGLGRAPVPANEGDPSSSSSSLSSSPSSPPVRSAPGSSDSPKHAAIASLAAAAAAADSALPTSPKRDASSTRVKPRQVSPLQRPDSLLPALARAIPTIVSGAECQQPRCFSSRAEPGRNASTTREVAGIVAGLRVSVRSPVIRPSPSSYQPVVRTPRAHDEGSDGGYDTGGHMQAPYHPDSSPRVFPAMVKTPRSPSACGETDSDHSDSTNGTGPGNCPSGVGEGDGGYPHKVHGENVGVSRAPRYHDTWQRGGPSHRPNHFVPPLKRLADVAASGVRSGVGKSRKGDGMNSFDYA